MGRDAEAEETYNQVLPILKDEPRCARVDWERHSVYVNIGNTWARRGDIDKANEQYALAEQLGVDHLKESGGSEDDGRSMVLCAKRSKAFALKKVGRIEDAKVLLKEVVEQKIKDDADAAKKKEEEAAKAAAGEGGQ